MAKKPTKKKKAVKPVRKPNSGNAPATDAKTRTRNWFFQPRTLMTAACVATVIAVAPHATAIVPDLNELEEYQVSLNELEVNQPHEWVPSTLLDDALSASGLPERTSILRPNLCQQIGSAFEEHPWVSEVRVVRLTSDRTIRVVVDYRRPVAFVRTVQGLMPIDENGILLPATDFEFRDIDRLPHIVNIDPPEVATVGQAWGGDLVIGAAKIAATLAPQQDMERYWNRFELTEIIAPDQPVNPLEEPSRTYELATKGGSRIIWGKPPGVDQLEPTAEQKIGRLEQYLSRFGRFDEPDGPYKIDIRHFDAISLQPMNPRYYR